MQFIIEALDHTDADALNRRMAVREQHLAGAAALRRSDNYILGGAKLDKDDKMIGSTMVLKFENEADFQAYFDQEPYVVNNVWGKINVYKFRVANITI